MDVFGVRVDEVSLKEAVERVRRYVERERGAGRAYFIVTPNPEQIVQAQSDKEFKRILNRADLAIPDGVGLRLVGVKNRVTGVELMEELAKTGKKMMYIGGSRGAAEATAEKLGGYGVGEVDEAVVKKINKYKPDVLCVGLGAPKQEKWVYKQLKGQRAKLKVKCVMVVGGALDQIADPTLRPPKFIDKMGLGWLYRLLRQPWRIKRQLRLVKFVGMVLDKWIGLD